MRDFLIIAFSFFMGMLTMFDIFLYWILEEHDKLLKKKEIRKRWK